jgi:hypothetical protein
MSVDAGMAQIASQFRADGPAAEVGVSLGLEARIGQLVGLLERRERRAQHEAQGCAPIDIGPLDFAISGGVAKFKTHRAAASDMSPQEGYVWFVQRLSLSGLNAGDLVNLYRTAAQATAQNMNAIHTFVGPASVAAGLGVADWEPGSLGLIMRPDDSFWIASAGTLVATEIILTGQAIQVAAPFLAEYLL